MNQKILLKKKKKQEDTTNSQLAGKLKQRYYSSTKGKASKPTQKRNRQVDQPKKHHYR